MIKQLRLENIGPAPLLEVNEFASRLNIFTGDNGLGKTFLLDACWYALTRTWAGNRPFLPSPDLKKTQTPQMTYEIIGKLGKYAKNHSRFIYKEQDWVRQAARPPMPGLVIHARIDGGFSVWDPARNYWRDDRTVGTRERPSSYQFTKEQVWDELSEGEGSDKRIFCNGLLRDLETWKTKDNDSFKLLEGVCDGLSSDRTETLKLGESVRLRLGDVREVPTLQMPYGRVPVTYAAAGMRRVLALAYLLVWAWQEHVLAASMLKEAPTRRVVILFDEVEAHLHPKWQRAFMPSLIRVVEGMVVKGHADTILGDKNKNPQQAWNAMTKKIPTSIQIIATTHSPLVMASVESLWNSDKDKLFDFNLDAKGKVELSELEFAKQGSAVNWLTSESFDLGSSYSIEAERAMKRADKFMSDHPDPKKAPASEKQDIQSELSRALGGDDEYWPYWLTYNNPPESQNDSRKKAR